MTNFTGKAEKPHDNVTNPQHYTSHPSGVECIQITEHCSFTVGNAIKYLWRADLKNGVEDLKKAAWYINREIEKREK
jgi:hypothetical protein